MGTCWNGLGIGALEAEKSIGKNKRTSEKFQSENRLKAYAMLGCTVMNARPHNAREKSVERFWGTLDNNFSKYLPGYAGKDILSKPESTERALKKRNILTIEEYRQALEKFIVKYNTDSHSGIEHKAPYEVWTRSLKEITHVDPELLAQMRWEFIAHVGERVEVALDPADLDPAYIFFEGNLPHASAADSKPHELRAQYRQKTHC